MEAGDKFRRFGKVYTVITHLEGPVYLVAVEEGVAHRMVIDERIKPDVEQLEKRNIKVVWKYWDGQVWCHEFKRDDVPECWRHEAKQVRVRVLFSYEGRQLKVEELR